MEDTTALDAVLATAAAARASDVHLTAGRRAVMRADEGAS